MNTKLTKGQKYNQNLDFAEWDNPHDEDTTGYHWRDYFADGVYLGPDNDGVEPLFAETGTRIG